MQIIVTDEMIEELNKRLTAKGSTYRLITPSADQARDAVTGTSEVDVAAVSPTSTPYLIANLTYANGTDTDEQYTQLIERSVENTSKATFEQGVKVGATIEVEYAAVKGSLSAEYSQNNTSESGRTESFHIHDEIPLAVKAGTEVTLQVVIQQEEAKNVPFTIKVRIDGGTVRYSPSNLKPLFRYRNGVSGGHFYTTNHNELGDGTGSWASEGIAGYLSDSAVAHTKPLYRYYNSVTGDHFYTPNHSELGDGGGSWRAEGIAGYLFTTQLDGTLPLYRYSNSFNSQHFYTTNLSELGNGSGDWHMEGTIGYMYSNPIMSGAINQLLPEVADRSFVIRGAFSGTAFNRAISVRLSQRNLDEGESLRLKKISPKRLHIESATIEQLRSIKIIHAPDKTLAGRIIKHGLEAKPHKPSTHVS